MLCSFDCSRRIHISCLDDSTFWLIEVILSFRWSMNWIKKQVYLKLFWISFKFTINWLIKYWWSNLVSKWWRINFYQIYNHIPNKYVWYYFIFLLLPKTFYLWVIGNITQQIFSILLWYKVVFHSKSRGVLNLNSPSDPLFYNFC